MRRLSEGVGSRVVPGAPGATTARMMRRPPVRLYLGAPRPIFALVTLLAVRGLILSPAGEAQVRLIQEEALRLAFPEPATIDRRTAFLDDELLVQARRLAGPDVTVDQRVVSYYVGREGDEVLGVAYFDSHRVRTLPEVLMIVVGPQDAVQRIEVLKFAEPPEYELPAHWLQQFDGKDLGEELSLKGRIVNMTGATLSSRAATRAVRRVLALHLVIRPFESREGGGR